MAIDARIGRPVAGDRLAAIVGSLLPGPFTVSDAALATVAAAALPIGAGRDLAPKLLGQLIPSAGGICILSGASTLGPVDTYLARLYRTLGDTDRARAHGEAGLAVTRSFAPLWHDVAAHWDSEEWP